MFNFTTVRVFPKALDDVRNWKFSEADMLLKANATAAFTLKRFISPNVRYANGNTTANKQRQSLTEDVHV